MNSFSFLNNFDNKVPYNNRIQWIETADFFTRFYESILRLSFLLVFAETVSTTDAQRSAPYWIDESQEEVYPFRRLPIQYMTLLDL